METVQEQADRLFKLHQTCGECQTAFVEADREYFAGDGGDPAAMKKRTDAAEKLNQAIAAAAELRRLAARHPGYFRTGWRDTEEMIPVPLTQDERLRRLSNQAEETRAQENERKAIAEAQRKQRIEERRRRDQEIRDERNAATEAAGQSTTNKPQRNQ